MRGLVYFSLLTLVSALALQSRAQATNQHYRMDRPIDMRTMPDPQILELRRGSRITANDPTPLDRALSIVLGRTTYTIGASITKIRTTRRRTWSTIPRQTGWRRAHPNGTTCGM